MGKLFPPFKVDIAGALCVPFTLRDARNRYQHGQISGKISYRIPLYHAQRRRIALVATEEQAPQIGRLAADNSEQFRVRAQGPGKGVRAGRGSGSAQPD